MSTPTVAITAAEACCSLGEGRSAILDAMLAGEVEIDAAPAIEGRFLGDSADRPVRAAQARESAPSVGSAPDRAEQLLHRTVRSALEEAGLDADTLRARCRAGLRVESIFGTTLGGMRHFGAALRSGDLDEYRRSTTATLVGDALRGTGLPEGGSTISAACASGVSAVAMGATTLLLDEADLVVAIAYDPISEFAFAGFNCLRLIAEGPLRPFTADREGMRVGEGFAVIVLEREAEATSRGARPLARILGWGAASDAHHLTQPVPDGAGAGRAIRAASASLLAAGRRPDFVAAHATSTPANDTAEHAALQVAFGADLPDIPVTALKSRIGHTLGAAGAIELSVAIEAMERGRIPSVANAEVDRDSFPELDLVVGEPRRVEASTAAVVSLGFGGADAAIVVESGSAPEPIVASPPVDATTSDDVVVTGLASFLPREGETLLAPDALDGLDDARAVRRLARFSVLVRAAGIQAARDAGLDAETIRASSAVVGTRFGATGYTLDYYEEIVRDGLGAGNPLFFAESVPNIGSAQLSLGMGIQGWTISVSGTTLAAFEAIHIARRHLASGQAETAIVVVAEESHDRVAEVLRDLDLLDDRGMAEGAVAFVLERRSAAERRGASIRGVVEDTRFAWPEGRGGLPIVRAARRAGAGVSDSGLPVVGCVDDAATRRVLRASLSRTSESVMAADSVARQSVGPARRLVEGIRGGDGGFFMGIDPSGVAGSVRIVPVCSGG